MYKYKLVCTQRFVNQCTNRERCVHLYFVKMTVLFWPYSDTSRLRFSQWPVYIIYIMRSCGAEGPDIGIVRDRYYWGMGMWRAYLWYSCIVLSSSGALAAISDVWILQVSGSDSRSVISCSFLNYEIFVLSYNAWGGNQCTNRHRFVQNREEPVDRADIERYFQGWCCSSCINRSVIVRMHLWPGTYFVACINQ